MFMFLGRNLEKKTGGANDWLKANGAEKTEGVVGTSILYNNKMKLTDLAPCNFPYRFCLLKPRCFHSN